MRMSTISVPLSDLGRKSEPPSVACSPSAATKLSAAAQPMYQRWCSAHSMRRL